MDEKIRIVISGSFRRDQDALREDFDELQRLGCEILSPPSIDWVDENVSFVVAEHDRDRAPQEIEAEHLAKIKESDFLWMHLPEGYIGVSAALELGWATAHSVPVYATRDVEEVGLQGLITIVASPEEAVEAITGTASTALVPTQGLRELQRYYAVATVSRGWDKETMEECLKLLRGELEELEEAVAEQGPQSVEAAYEMVDVLFYLLHLANIVGTALDKAVEEKEQINVERFGPVGRS